MHNRIFVVEENVEFAIQSNSCKKVWHMVQIVGDCECSLLIIYILIQGDSILFKKLILFCRVGVGSVVCLLRERQLHMRLRLGTACKHVHAIVLLYWSTAVLSIRSNRTVGTWRYRTKSIMTDGFDDRHRIDSEFDWCETVITNLCWFA